MAAASTPALKSPAKAGGRNLPTTASAAWSGTLRPGSTSVAANPKDRVGTIRSIKRGMRAIDLRSTATFFAPIHHVHPVGQMESAETRMELDQKA